MALRSAWRSSVPLGASSAPLRPRCRRLPDAEFPRQTMALHGTGLTGSAWAQTPSAGARPKCWPGSRAGRRVCSGLRWPMAADSSQRPRLLWPLAADGERKIRPLAACTGPWRRLRASVRTVRADARAKSWMSAKIPVAKRKAVVAALERGERIVAIAAQGGTSPSVDRVEDRSVLGLLGRSSTAESVQLRLEDGRRGRWAQRAARPRAGVAGGGVPGDPLVVRTALAQTWIYSGDAAERAGKAARHVTAQRFVGRDHGATPTATATGGRSQLVMARSRWRGPRRS